MKIVGYTYAADIMCRACIAQKFTWRGYHVHDAETVLDLAAARRGIDRRDEHSFDSGAFPKVIGSLDANDATWDHCGECGDCIDHGKVECTGDCEHVWIAGMTYVAAEDLAAAIRRRYLPNASPVECERCGLQITAGMNTTRVSALVESTMARKGY